MNFVASRLAAIKKLNKFVEQNLIEYSRLRNFDYGPNDRSNISCLSPYISHGVISELEVIKKSLSKFSFVRNEKFIQGNLLYGFEYLENNDNQIVPIVKVDSSKIKMINQY